jgi:precorrin-4 methylase
MKIKRLIYCLMVTAFLVISLKHVCLAQTSVQGQEIIKEKPKFYFVGMGPGDADLITLRGLKAIKDADLIFCSKKAQEKFAPYLEGKELLVGSSYRLSRHYGKGCSKLKGKELEECEHYTNKRNKLIKKIRQAIGEGKTVAVLGSGDPFIYGPAVWFLEEFADLDPVVVPGLSSFNAANAALAKNVTSNKPTKSVILTIGYSPESRKTIENLAVHKATMVVYMPRDLKDMVERLSAHYPPQTPIALVSYAGYKEKEKVIKGTLKTILDKIGDEKELKLYLLYVGDFLKYRRK